uniref:Uncharacterized protein n=1 Tax=Arundo donax TaxID=35708 RepID=A0A0A9EMH5_ARUDO
MSHHFFSLDMYLIIFFFRHVFNFFCFFF